jgi:hypothetical protein
LAEDTLAKYSAINKEGFNVLSRRWISYDMQWSATNGCDIGVVMPPVT